MAVPATTHLKRTQLDDAEVDASDDTNGGVRVDRWIHKVKSVEGVKGREGNMKSDERKAAWGEE
jgi:hypothetical protein